MIKRQLLFLPLLALSTLSLAGCKPDGTSTPPTSTPPGFTLDPVTRKFMDTYTFTQDPGPDGISANLFGANLGSTDDLITITGLIRGQAVSEMTIPADVRGVAVTAIGEKAFQKSNESKTTIEKMNLPASIEKIGDLAFYGMTKFSSLTLPADSKLSSLGEACLAETPFLTAAIAETEASHNPYYLGNVLLLSPSDLAGSLTIKEGTLAIADGALKGRSGLSSLTLPASLLSIGSEAIYGTGISTLQIPDAVKSIGSQAFGGNMSLAEIRFPKRLDFTYDSTPAYLAGSTNLVELSYDGNAELQHLFSTADLADKSKLKLTTVEVYDNAAHTLVKDALNGFSTITTLKVQDGLKVIEDGALTGLNRLSSFDAPADLEYLGESDLAQTPYYQQLADGPIYVGRCFFGFKGAVPASFAFEAGTAGLSAASIKNLLPLTELPATVKYVGPQALAGNKTLSRVTLPHLVYAGEEAFKDCSALTAIELNSNAILSRLMLANCLAVRTMNMNITLSMSVLFGSTLPLIENLIIPEGITEIGEGIFKNFKSLKSVSLPSTLNKIGNEAFYGCENLASITIPERVTDIGNWAFAYCSKLTSVTLEPTTLTKVDDYGITRCLYELSLGFFCFAYCESLGGVFTIPNRTMRVCGAVFFGASLDSILIELDPHYLQDLSIDRFNPLNPDNTMKYYESWNQDSETDKYGNQIRIPYRTVASPFATPQE